MKSSTFEPGFRHCNPGNDTLSINCCATLENNPLLTYFIYQLLSSPDESNLFNCKHTLTLALDCLN
jgi:hypothetical protein